MIDRPDFETRLATRLSAHTADVVRPFDAATIAAGAGAGHRGSRRPLAALRMGGRLAVPGVVWIVLAMLLLAMVGAGLIAGGRPVFLAVQATPTPTPTASPTPSSLPLAILPGESWILYERFTQLGGGLFAMRPDGTDSHAVAADIPGVHKESDWSPDGQRIVFIDETAGFMWVVGIDGSDAQRIGYCDRGGCGKPAWSPDGTRIAFSLTESKAAIQGPAAESIIVLDLATGKGATVARLARPLLVDVARWSPDGKQLVVGVDRMDVAAEEETGSAIAVVPVAGGELRYLTDFALFGYAPDWGPNDQIVFSTQTIEFKKTPDRGDTTWDLYVVKADGTGLRRLTRVDPGIRLWNPIWTPDGTSILAAEQGARLLFSVDPTTGALDKIGGAAPARALLRPPP